MSPAGKQPRLKRLTVVGLLVVLAGSASFWGLRYAHSTPSIPTAVVRRAAFVNWLELQGHIDARDSVDVSAPYQVGQLRILKLVSDGARVKKGEMLVEFDPTQIQQTLAQDRVALKSAEAVVEQSRAKAQMKEEEDLTAVMTDRYNVQKAQLEASKAEIVSQITGEENKLKLVDARQQLAAAEATLKDDRIADAADINAKRQARDQARYQLQRDQRNLAQLTIRAPIDGIVTLLETSSGPFSGLRPFRPGDQIWPGASVAELPNLSKLEVVARVDETERGRLEIGQQADIRFSAIPDRPFTGRIEQISTLASMDFSAGWPPARDFTVRIALDESDPRLRPDMGGTVRVAVDRVPSGIVIPSQAVFHKNGERIVYVLRGSKFELRVIVVAAESGGEALIAKGLEPGERVALKNPEPQA